MDSIKTEPASDGELYSVSNSDRQHVDREGELKSLLVRFPQMKLFMYIIYSEFSFLYDDFDSDNDGTLCRNWNSVRMWYGMVTQG
jgi:hypothetical protein